MELSSQMYCSLLRIGFYTKFICNNAIWYCMQYWVYNFVFTLHYIIYVTIQLRFTIFQISNNLKKFKFICWWMRHCSTNFIRFIDSTILLDS